MKGGCSIQKNVMNVWDSSYHHDPDLNLAQRSVLSDAGDALEGLLGRALFCFLSFQELKNGITTRTVGGTPSLRDTPEDSKTSAFVFAGANTN